MADWLQSCSHFTRRARHVRLDGRLSQVPRTDVRHSPAAARTEIAHFKIGEEFRIEAGEAAPFYRDRDLRRIAACVKKNAQHPPCFELSRCRHRYDPTAIVHGEDIVSLGAYLRERTLRGIGSEHFSDRQGWVLCHGGSPQYGSCNSYGIASENTS
jgi:hypothetical protein